MDYQRKSIRHQGFTVIELLVVVGIIAVLAAIAVVGIGKVMNGQNRTQSRTVLASVQSMLGEFDRETSLKRQPPHQWNLTSNALYPAATALDFWRDTDPTTAGTQGIDLVATPTKDLGEDRDSMDGPRDDVAVVKNTQLAMYMFNQVASVKKMLSAMPQGSLVTIKDATATAGYDEHAVGIPKDAWGNVMVLVPASGLRGVTLADDATTKYVITSVKIYKDVTAAAVGGLVNGDLAPGARPFFASPGPDGHLETGDDNLYSFENQ